LLYSCTIRWTLKTIHALLTKLAFGEYLCAFMQIFMPYWNYEYTKAVIIYTLW